HCLESLADLDVVLINDCTPDLNLAAYLREIASARGWTLLENPTNLGFAASVNRGIEIYPDRDVVVLNNDTRVSGDWLERLQAAAYSQERVGTVTPFSNNATICSYPKPGSRLADLDPVFREVNAQHRIPLPTAVGFCMYIRRDCLTDVGSFRTEIFG